MSNRKTTTEQAKAIYDEFVLNPTATNKGVAALHDTDMFTVSRIRNHPSTYGVEGEPIKGTKIGKGVSPKHKMEIGEAERLYNLAKENRESPHPKTQVELSEELGITMWTIHKIVSDPGYYGLDLPPVTTHQSKSKTGRSRGTKVPVETYQKAYDYMVKNPAATTLDVSKKFGFAQSGVSRLRQNPALMGVNEDPLPFGPKGGAAHKRGGRTKTSTDAALAIYLDFEMNPKSGYKSLGENHGVSGFIVRQIVKNPKKYNLDLEPLKQAPLNEVMQAAKKASKTTTGLRTRGVHRKSLEAAERAWPLYKLHPGWGLTTIAKKCDCSVILIRTIIKDPERYGIDPDAEVIAPEPPKFEEKLPEGTISEGRYMDSLQGKGVTREPPIPESVSQERRFAAQRGEEAETPSMVFLDEEPAAAVSGNGLDFQPDTTLFDEPTAALNEYVDAYTNALEKGIVKRNKYIVKLEGQLRTAQHENKEFTAQRNRAFTMARTRLEKRANQVLSVEEVAEIFSTMAGSRF